MERPLSADEQARARKAARKAGANLPALIVTEKRATAVPFGPTAKKVYFPGDVVRRPTIAEAQFLSGCSEPLEQWFGGPLGEPERVAGRLYPELLQRKADGSLWVRTRPDFIQQLKDAPRTEAVDAVRRCSDPQVLARVSEVTSDPTVLSVAKAAIEGRTVPEDSLVALTWGEELQGAVLVKANGSEVSAGEFYEDELRYFAETCDDPRVMQWLASNGSSARVKDLGERRLAELGGARRAPGTKGEKPAPEARAEPVTAAALILALNGEGRASIASGDKLSPASAYTVDDLKPAIEACSDVAILGALFQEDERKGVQEAAGLRIGSLQGLRLQDGLLVFTDQLNTFQLAEVSIPVLRPLIEAEERPEILDALALDERKGVQAAAAERLATLTAPAEPAPEENA